MVTDPDLNKHLAHWGINMMQVCVCVVVMGGGGGRRGVDTFRSRCPHMGTWPISPYWL
jgi:hypothetical protein